MESIRLTAPGARVLFLPDPDDEEEIAELKGAGADFHATAGNYAHKINMGVRVTDEALIFLAADDLNFHHGWLEAAKAKLGPGIGVVGTNDLCNRRTINGTHSTHSLVTREYVGRGTIDDPGKLLHEGYRHEYVDDEFVATAKKRRAWAHARDSIIEHLHPDAGKAPMDALYRGRPARMRQGYRLFRRRRRLWT